MSFSEDGRPGRDRMQTYDDYLETMADSFLEVVYKLSSYEARLAELGELDQPNAPNLRKSLALRIGNDIRNAAIQVFRTVSFLVDNIQEIDEHERNMCDFGRVFDGAYMEEIQNGDDGKYPKTWRDHVEEMVYRSGDCVSPFSVRATDRMIHALLECEAIDIAKAIASTYAKYVSIVSCELGVIDWHEKPAKGFYRSSPSKLAGALMDSSSQLAAYIESPEIRFALVASKLPVFPAWDRNSKTPTFIVADKNLVAFSIALRNEILRGEVGEERKLKDIEMEVAANFEFPLKSALTVLYAKFPEVAKHLDRSMALIGYHPTNPRPFSKRIVDWLLESSQPERTDSDEVILRKVTLRRSGNGFEFYRNGWQPFAEGTPIGPGKDGSTELRVSLWKSGVVSPDSFQIPLNSQSARFLGDMPGLATRLSLN